MVEAYSVSKPQTLSIELEHSQGHHMYNTHEVIELIWTLHTTLYNIKDLLYHTRNYPKIYFNDSSALECKLHTAFEHYSEVCQLFTPPRRDGAVFGNKEKQALIPHHTFEWVNHRVR